MHLQRFCYIMQHQRSHRFFTVFQKSALPLDDDSCHFEQGFTAALQAFDEPAGFLQVVTHRNIFVAAVGAFDQAGVDRVDPQLGYDVAVQLVQCDGVMCQMRIEDPGEVTFKAFKSATVSYEPPAK